MAGLLAEFQMDPAARGQTWEEWQHTHKLRAVPPRPPRPAPPSRPQEVLAQQAAGPSGHAEVDIDDLLDDPDLEKLHAERLAALRADAEKRAKLEQKGHGAPAAGLTFIPTSHCRRRCRGGECQGRWLLRGLALGSGRRRVVMAWRPLTLNPSRARHSALACCAGQYEEVAEGDFLEVVTKTGLVVCHFFHRDFERCRWGLMAARVVHCSLLRHCAQQ